MSENEKTAVITVTFYRGVAEPSLDRLSKKYIVKRWRDEAHLRQLMDEIAREMNYISGYGILHIKAKSEQLNFTANYQDIHKPYSSDKNELIHGYWFSLKFIVGHSYNSGYIARLVIPRVNITNKIAKYDPNNNLLQIRAVAYHSKKKKKRAKSRYNLYFDSKDPIFNSFLQRISTDNVLEPQTRTQWQFTENGISHSNISWWTLPNAQTTLYQLKKLRKQKEKEERERVRLEKSGIIYTDRAKKKKADQVYLIKMDDETLAKPIYKIGISNDPHKRLQTLNTSSPFELKIIHKFVANPAIEAETQLHLRYQDDNMRREWFGLSEEQVVKFKRIIGFIKGEFVYQ